MWIVRLALRRPYTFVVAAILVAILGIFMITQTMATDIFPNIDIPVISVIFNYTGMTPDEMDKRMMTPFERFLTTTVKDIEHIESQSLNGISICKVYFQKGAKIEEALAQITGVAQTAIRIMPPGTQPPLVMQFSASTVPIVQISCSSDTMSEQQLFDKAVNFLRPTLVTIPGLQTPYPYGGKQRQTIVDLDPDKLFAYGLSAASISDAVVAQNVILPSGMAKVGVQEYPVRLNSSPELNTALNDLPIKTVNGRTIYIHDVAHVRDGFSVQTNIVHTNGKRGVLMSIYKLGNASTLAVVDAVKRVLPVAQQQLPKEMKLTLLFDQSIFVRASVEGVVKEACIAAGLTALMILLFLGSWRSTIIVIISIPLSILVSIIILGALGETLNVMTLGGMALAVGILVDDATVEIENIHRNLHQRKRLVKAILDGASQIAVPAFVSTLCICIVFVPVVFISGAAKYLFTPLALAVVFAMLTSYLLSRTLVPTMVHYLLAAEVEMYGGVIDASDPHAMKLLHAHEAHAHENAALKSHHRKVMLISLLVLAACLAASGYVITATDAGNKYPAARAMFVGLAAWAKDNWQMLAMVAMSTVAAIMLVVLVVVRIHGWFERQFEKLRRFYGGLLDLALDHRPSVIVGFIVMVCVSCGLFVFIGRDFFPSVDAGQIRLHVRCPPGTRIEVTEQRFARIEDALVKDDQHPDGVIPKKEVITVLDNIGIPYSGINMSLSDGSMISAADGEILVNLTAEHAPTAQYMRQLRPRLEKLFPDTTFYFAPSDIVTQVLNFGLAAPVDIQLIGPKQNSAEDYRLARKILREVAVLPGVVDARLQQVPRTPDLRVNVNRDLASKLGVTQAVVANDLLVSLSSAAQTAPTYWLDPVTGVSYTIFVQTPQYRVDTLDALKNTPIIPVSAAPTPENTQVLSNMAETGRSVSPTNVTHYDINDSFDVLLGVQGADLGSTADRIDQVLAKYRDPDAKPEYKLPRGSRLAVRGQALSMRQSFTGLSGGLIFAVVLVYLLMVINFQSWLDPLIILMALPGALAGILWMLWATHTNISVPALMGAIMSIGVATSNSILMITFANDQREEGMDARTAALAAGMTRLRPVLMTALAMIIGMLPMSLGLGEGGEQNAPLGRAVIGGLAMATFATLFFVPVVYSLMRRHAAVKQVEPELQ